MKNKTYVGYIGVGVGESRDKGTWVEGKHEGIIDLETFEKAQLKMKELDYKKNIGKELQNPLATILVCSKCGRVLQRYYDIKNDRSYLYCRTRHCPTSSSNLVNIEKDLIEELKQELVGFNYFLENYSDEIKKKKINNEKEIKLINKEILKKENMLNKCCELLEQGIYTTEKYTQRVNVLDSELADLKSTLTELIESNIDEKEENIRTAIPIIEKVVCNEYWNLSAKEKNEILKSIIDKIEYTKEGRNYRNNYGYNFNLKIYMKI